MINQTMLNTSSAFILIIQGFRSETQISACTYIPTEPWSGKMFITRLAISTQRSTMRVNHSHMRCLSAIGDGRRHRVSAQAQVRWLLDYLSDRMQRVRVNSTFQIPSSRPQVLPNDVLSHPCSTLYTNDCVSRPVQCR